MLQTVKGTKDILPAQSFQWQFIEAIFRSASKAFGYREIRTPIFEFTELFARGVGETTDIVGKEMYTFIDKGGDSLTLRPELTACVARAVLQHSLMADSPTQRLWYAGAMFRHENPQLGRQRQFHQYGAEILGSAYPEADAEIIALADHILRLLGLESYELEMNSIGNSASRQAYRAALIDYFTPLKAELSTESQARLEKNPLRILDSKDKRDVAARKDAPIFGDFLDEESKSYFSEVLGILDEWRIPHILNPQLARGLDYYSHTVFEFTTDRLGGTQNTIASGGRYDGLFQQLGARQAIPGVGFAAGIERLFLLLAEEKKTVGEPPLADVYVVALDAESRRVGFEIALGLRKKGFAAMTDVQRRSTKAQMREAAKIGARFAAIIGETERAEGTVMLKNLGTGEQSAVLVSEIDSFLQ